MARRTQREIVLLMAREIDPTDAPEDDEYISDWEPGHTVCDGQGDPGCSGCWVASYDEAREEVP